MNEPGELLVDRPAQDILRLRLNRPDRLNAIDMPLVNALLAAFDDVEARAVVLGSSTPKAFCSGADLDLEDEERARVSDLLYELYEEMVKLPVPVVVALDGHVVGGGAQLAVAGDLRIGGPDTKIRVAGPGHGLAVAAWGLPSLIGRGRALDLCLTMRTVGAEEALALGLVDRIEAEPGEAALDLASELARLDPAAVGRVKRVVSVASGSLDALREERMGNKEHWSGSVAALRRGQGDK
ncbi:Enoyl-CoA hydratase [uncultured Rubrobacteraceae bacterium]|uniref:Enoyl-CoA hydratase n=1 Tax=uncultured Rubrobacteraceae bacterium TaxID=349277 RepID=A0A6J4P504_9ACTN|nr:Enoyl-CoA hydratase [uncultured Rubrobacteraceae bacterium]